jgi:hypothetical protein
MGAWGEKAFQNDSALDWLAEFEGRGVVMLRKTLSRVADVPVDDYLDVDDGTCSIAAAEIDGGELWTLDLPAKNQPLLTEHQILRDQESSRPGEIDDQPKGRRHRLRSVANERAQVSDPATDDVRETAGHGLQHRPSMHRKLGREMLV